MGTSKYAGGNPAMDWHPVHRTTTPPPPHPGGSSIVPSRFMLRKSELSAGPMGHLGLYKGFTLYVGLRSQSSKGRIVSSTLPIHSKPFSPWAKGPKSYAS